VTGQHVSFDPSSCRIWDLEPHVLVLTIPFEAQKLVFLPFSIQEDWDTSYGNWMRSEEPWAATFAKCT
jgi:hypothetical protein